jgi:hypothetical protein
MKIMNDNDWNALEASIAHWRDNEDREKENKDLSIGMDACALCQLQKQRVWRVLSEVAFTDEDAGGMVPTVCCMTKDAESDYEEDWPMGRTISPCVIAAFTGRSSCDGTPYYDAAAEDIPASVMTKWLEQLYSHMRNPSVNAAPAVKDSWTDEEVADDE